MDLRKQIKSKKPDFIRQDANKKKRLERRWRKPKGLHSKIRLNLRGRAKGTSQGYRSPKKVRGLYKNGLQHSRISSVKDLEIIDPKENCIIISSSLGNKKRIDILKKAKERGFVISNIKDPDTFVKKIEDNINLKRKIKEDAKEKKKVTKTKKKESKLTEKVSDDSARKPTDTEETRPTSSGSAVSGIRSMDKEDIEKKEKDRFLTKKNR